MPLRHRLLLTLLTTVVLALVIVGALTYALVTQSQLAQVDDDLERAHPQIEEAASAEGEAGLQAIREAAPGLYTEIRDADGTSVLVVPLRSGNGDLVTLAGREIPAPPPAAIDTDDGPGPDTGDDPLDEVGADRDGAVYATIDVAPEVALRVRTTRRGDGSLLIIGRLLEELERTRHRLLIVLATTGLGAVLAALGVGTWMVRSALRPLHDVERAASGIGDDDLGRRVPGADATTEVGQLATTINRMLERLEDSFSQRERDMAAIQESESRMRRFVADASHELRTPIAATSAYAELFERGASERPDDLARAMSGIRNETGRMGELVDDLLLLARLDEGRPLELREVDLADVVADAVDAAAMVDPDHPVTIRLDQVAIVRCDQGRVRQVVDNLLGNVRTHTPAGTACEVRVAVEGDRAVLTVRDDGPGMSADDAGRAFDRFHRADVSRTRASGGNGLGLSIVAAIAEAHGGRVELDSAPDAGTMVRVELPVDGPGDRS